MLKKKIVVSSQLPGQIKMESWLWKSLKPIVDNMPFNIFTATYLPQQNGVTKKKNQTKHG